MQKTTRGGDIDKSDWIRATKSFINMVSYGIYDPSGVKAVCSVPHYTRVEPMDERGVQEVLSRTGRLLRFFRSKEKYCLSNNT